MSHKVTMTKFILSYIYNITILVTSHKVTKTIFDKTKTIRPKTWSIGDGLIKKSLMTYQRLIFTNSLVTKKKYYQILLSQIRYSLSHTHIPLYLGPTLFLYS